MAPWYSPRRWISSARYAVSFTRAYLSGLAALRSSPARPGISSGRVASNPMAELDLGAMATSPTIFAAVTRGALEITAHPIQVYRGYALAGGDLEPIDARRVPWAAAFLRLLQAPDVASASELAPQPGEHLVKQAWADLKLIGAFVIVPTFAPSPTPGGEEWVVGLTRLHPRCCTLERGPQGDELVYRNGSEVRRYPRWSCFIGSTLSWASDGRSEFGVGAGTPLRQLVRAESVALEQTANMVEQGGADIQLRGKGATGKNFMASKENREKAVSNAIEAIKGPNGRRVFALSDDVEMVDSQVKPADLRAPEMMEAAHGRYLMAIGAVPAWVGASKGTYADAVLQLRVQAGMDEGYAGIFEAYFLRPLARHFARTRGASTMDSRRWEQLTARIDLALHPGYAQLRTEAFARMRVLVHDLGYTVEQAAAIEGLDLPAPEGEILSKGQPSQADQVPGPDQGSIKDQPRAPVGDGGDAKVSNPDPQRSFIELLRAE